MSPAIRFIDAIHHILWRHGLGEKGGFASICGLTHTIDSNLSLIDAVHIGKNFCSRNNPPRRVGYALVMVATCNIPVQFSLKNVVQSTVPEEPNVLELSIPTLPSRSHHTTDPST